MTALQFPKIRVGPLSFAVETNILNHAGGKFDKTARWRRTKPRVALKVLDIMNGSTNTTNLNTHYTIAQSHNHKSEKPSLLLLLPWEQLTLHLVRRNLHLDNVVSQCYQRSSSLYQTIAENRFADLALLDDINNVCLISNLVFSSVTCDRLQCARFNS